MNSTALKGYLRNEIRKGNGKNGKDPCPDRQLALEAVKNGNDSVKSLLAEAVGLLKRVNETWSKGPVYELKGKITAFLAKVEAAGIDLPAK